MRNILLTAALVVMSVSSAFAQQTKATRFEVGPVVRVDKVTIENTASGATAVVGVAARYSVWRVFGVEAELTSAHNTFEYSYQGSFISYAGPNSTREEIERMAPTARRTLSYAPGVGWSFAATAAGHVASRTKLGVRGGLAGRRYDQVSRYTVLAVPPGVDPARVARDFAPSSTPQTRMGVLVGVDASVQITNRFTITPEVRAVFGGIGDYLHREVGAGVRCAWGF